MTTAKDRVLARIVQTADKTASARERKQAKGSATGYVSVWNDVVMDAYGKEHCIAPTIKVSGMLKKALNRLPNQSTAHIKLFINWTVNEWPRLRGENKKWPEVPDIASFVYAVPRLYSDYCRKDETKVRSNGLKKSNAVVEKRASTMEAKIVSLTLELDAANKTIATLRSQIELLKGK